ncbi:Thioredoxin X [Chlorella vulgaris]
MACTTACTSGISALASSRRSAAPAAAAHARPAASLVRLQQRSRVQGGARRLSARRHSTCVRAVLDATEANFEEEVLKSKVPVLVDVWATWCGPCKLMSPMMDWAEKEYGAALKVTKMEADPNPALVEEYKVYGLPCFLLFRDGALVEGSRTEGAMSKKGLQEYLAKHGISAPAKV